METFSTLLAFVRGIYRWSGGGGGGGGSAVLSLCERTGGSPHKGPVMWSIDSLVFVWRSWQTNWRVAGDFRRHDAHMTSFWWMSGTHQKPPPARYKLNVAFLWDNCLKFLSLNGLRLSWIKWNINWNILHGLWFIARPLVLSWNTHKWFIT